MRAFYTDPFAFLYEEQKQVHANHDKPSLPNEFEILEANAFASDHHFDVYVEYAKEIDTGSVYIHIHVRNRSEREPEITILPNLWFQTIRE